MAQDLFDFHKANYRPLEQQAIADAGKAGSPEEMENRAGQAGATVAQQFGNARRDLGRTLSMYNARRGGGAFADMERQSAIDEAAATAGAENNARQDERKYGLAAKLDVSNLGRNNVSNASSALAAGSRAASDSAESASTQQKILNGQYAQIGNLLSEGQSLSRSFSAPPSTIQPAPAGGYNYGNPALVQPSFESGFYRKGGLARPPRHPQGGRVTGPGTGTSDSIPVMIDGKTPGALSSGEYVINAAAVKKHGIKNLDKINAKGLPRPYVMRRGEPRYFGLRGTA